MTETVDLFWACYCCADIAYAYHCRQLQQRWERRYGAWLLSQQAEELD